RQDAGSDVPATRQSPVHLLVDSTELKLCGSGEWLLEKHGTKTRHAWCKLDADTDRLLAATLDYQRLPQSGSCSAKSRVLSSLPRQTGSTTRMGSTSM
ncbi:MAG: hypothetical protein ACRYHQ_35240, partial [Janthinobacterium lividum]